jgi:phosphohistidine phosphatase
MSRELYILRHAKSDWGQNAGLDISRPLNRRGRKDAPLLGAWMREHYLYPGRVYCSTAVRARETLELISQELELKPDSIEYRNDLYLASSSTLLSLLREIPTDYDSVMLVGHNPGLQDLFGIICNTPLPRSQSGKLLTTACLVQLKLPDDWHELAGRAELVRVIRPAEIEE